MRSILIFAKIFQCVVPETLSMMPRAQSQFGLVVLPLLTISLVEVRALQSDNQTVTCGSTEVHFLNPNQSAEFECDCSNSSVQCSWNMFSDRGEILSNSSTKSVLTWQKTGYGHYVCVKDYSTVVRNVLILPEGEELASFMNVFM